MAEMHWGVFLDWERCPDGVKLIDDADDPSSKIFEASSIRRKEFRLGILNLESPIIVRFINARDEKRRLAFFGEYGLLLKAGNTAGYVDKKQRSLLTLLRHAGSGDPMEATRAVDRAFVGWRLKPNMQIIDHETKQIGLLLEPDDGLYGFMRLEAAMVATAGAKTGACQYCGNLFLTGPMTGRRDTAQYCTPTHRVAAMRARQAAEERKA